MQKSPVKNEFGAFLERLNAAREELAVCTDLLAEAVWEWAPGQILENFEAGQSQWPPLKENTLQKRRARGNDDTRMLEDTMNLLGSLVNSRETAVHIVGTNRVVYGTDVPYAPIQQYGAPRRNIPKRPFMINGEQNRGFAQVMQEKLVDLLGSAVSVRGKRLGSSPSRSSRRSSRRSMQRSARQLSRKSRGR